MSIHVSELYTWPVKSCGGVELREAKIESRGFAMDRRWMLVDSGGVFVSQREIPLLSMIRILIGDDELLISHHRKVFDPLTVPFQDPSGEVLDVVVWSSRCKAIAVSKKADDWFSDLLGIDCRLVYMPESTIRKVNARYAQNGELLSFVDGYPFLAIGQASLNDLNNRLKRPVSIKQFRPNIVFTGMEAYAEDDWEGIRIGKTVFFKVKNCTRCSITTVNLLTGEKKKEPLATLSKYRKVGKDVEFGVYLISSGKGIVRVGDTVELI